MTKTLLTVLLISLIPVHATASPESAVVFQYELNAKLPKAPGLCAVIGGNPKSLCWIDTPFNHKGSKYGVVQIPEERLPGWALYALPRITIDADGRLQEISFSNVDVSKEKLTIESIASRFGTPSIDNGPYIRRASWTTPKLAIGIACYQGLPCEVSFRSKEHAQQQLDEQMQREAKERARPKTP